MRACVVTLIVTLGCLAPLAAADCPLVEGWSETSPARLFGPDTLWEEINGAADVFIGYGFQRLTSCELAAGDLTVSVGVYDMGSPINAFGVYRTELPDGATTLDIGAEAFLSPPYQALLLKDRFYVKIDAYEGEISEAAGRQLLHGLADALPGAAGLPEPLLSLPHDGLVAGSQGFARDSFLGLAELARTVFASYRDDDGASYRVFRILAMPGDTEAAVWQRLAERWVGVESPSGEILARNVPYQGVVGVIRTSNGIFGVADNQDKAQMVGRLSALAQ
jgi:hypothetical protein